MTSTWDIFSKPIAPCAPFVAAFVLLGYHLLYVALASASAVAFPTYRRLPRHERQQWNASLVAIAYAVGISVTATRLLASYAVAAKRGEAQPLTWWTPGSASALWASLAYFAVDAAAAPGGCCFLPHRPAMALHHAVCAAGLGIALATRVAHAPMLTLLLTELTTPFVVARWMLDKVGARATRAYLVNGACMAVLWAPLRLLPFWTYYSIVTRDVQEARRLLPPAALAFTLGGPCALGVLNVYWFGLILRGFVVHVLKRLRR